MFHRRGGETHTRLIQNSQDNAFLSFQASQHFPQVETVFLSSSLTKVFKEKHLNEQNCIR